MPVKKVIEKWGFKCLGFETKENGDEVMLIWCKLCREFSEITDVPHKKKGVAKIATETYVKGTKVIKKNNFTDHILHSKTHASAVIRISERNAQREKERNQSSACSTSESLSSSSMTVPSGAPRQTTLMPYVQRLNAAERSQLTRKMQLAHFTVINSKSFNFYSTLSNFCQNTLKVSKAGSISGLEY